MTDDELDSAYFNHLHDLGQVRVVFGSRRRRRRRAAPRRASHPSPYLTVEEAAAYCRVAVQTIYNHRRYIERLPGIGTLLFTREALDRWLSTRRRR